MHKFLSFLGIVLKTICFVISFSFDLTYGTIKCFQIVISNYFEFFFPVFIDDQWEQFMTDKESCLERMKAECRQEGEEERVKREKELLDEIAGTYKE